MHETVVTNGEKAPKPFTFDVEFVIQVLAETEEEASAICADKGGYLISRKQTLRG